MSRRQPPRSTLGPVSDLERHLPADWWRDLFDALYLETDGDVVEDAAITRQEVDVFEQAAGLSPDDRILDLCCGQGRHTLELARRGYRALTGLDRSRYLVRLARRRARGANLDVRFREGDARRVAALRTRFDAVLVLGNSFGYFEKPEEDHAVLVAIRQALAPGGTVLLDLADGTWLQDHFEKRSWEWIDANRFVCRERSLAADGERLISREVVVDAEKGVIADQFYAERLYTEARIRGSLTAAGFHDITVHGQLATSSSRNQDLGMMAHRIVVTARTPASRAEPPGPALPPITVLLGDPKLPDPVKLEGKFNADDLDTVRRMKAALASIPGLKVDYLDDHGELLSRLRRDPPAFVLNLLDEGFANDPHKELHVPALLELLGIPTTGAGPTCLGLCYDKSLVRAIAASLDIAVPHETYVGAEDHAGTLPTVFPALLKPALGDSSVGITEAGVVHSPEQAVEAMQRLRAAFPEIPILVQEYLTGAEFTVGLVGNPGMGLRALPILEVDYSELPPELPRILSYASKWELDSPYVTAIHYRETEASDEVQRTLVDASMRLFERLGCRDYARFDFRADADGVVKLLEVNPNPGWCWDGKMAMMVEQEGGTYADLLRAILEAGWTRVQADRRG
ncbi:MAG: methyltransferase domain-containing protein [Alphaproteobacteria bacterium]|nr:methyltransferase domain-containing protein [Alphaproteobacteria bacterium]